MINPISPEFVYVIHKDKERQLMREIEMIRTAKERGTAEAIAPFGELRAWFAQASRWMQGKVFNRAPERARAGSQPETFEQPCPDTVPC